jgi:hypothetical protein
MHNNVYSLLPILDLIEYEFLDYDKKFDSEFLSYNLMLNSGKKLALRATKKINILTLLLFEKKILKIRISNNEFFLVGVIYRPPNSIYIWDLFCESVDKALDSDLPLFLV